MKAAATVKAAVDTNILFDLLAGDAAAAAAAAQLLTAAIGSGPTVICPVVYAELAAGFERQQELEDFLRDLGLQFEAFSTQALYRAAEAWRAYARRRSPGVQCPRCGQRSAVQCSSCQHPIVWRQHIIADFLVGGHAVVQADLLITRDPGYYRTYFPDLRLEVPTPARPPQG